MFRLLIAAVATFWTLSVSAPDRSRADHLPPHAPERQRIASAKVETATIPTKTIQTATISTGTIRTGAIVARPFAKSDAPQVVSSDRVITLVLVGDTGFGGTMQPVDPLGGRRHGQRIPFDRMTRGVRDLIDGDINFANLETVVTRRRGLSAVPKAFKFRSHPAGVAHLVDAVGFNLFSLANNHAVDFGRAGLSDTLEEMERLETRILGYAGLGFTRTAAAAPWIFGKKDRRFAFSAIGIGASGSAFSPGQGRVGQLPYNQKAFDAVAEKLTAAPADVRILSVHTGLERQLTPTSTDKRRFMALASTTPAVDLVVGHHAHVAQGVQKVGRTLVLYGLGNFLHPGMQDMGKMGRCRDFGLVAKVHYVKTPDRGVELAAVEAVPIRDMHARPYSLKGRAARTRIGVLNGLAKRLDDPKRAAAGLRFAMTSNGRGLHCEPSGRKLPGAVGKQCRAWNRGGAVATIASRPKSVAAAERVSRVSLNAVDTKARTAPDIPHIACGAVRPTPAVARLTRPRGNAAPWSFWGTPKQTTRSRRATRARVARRRARSNARRRSRTRAVSSAVGAGPSWTRSVFGN